MTKAKALIALERKGYKVVRDLNTGKVIAKKGSQTYDAASLTALKKKVLG